MYIQEICLKGLDRGNIVHLPTKNLEKTIYFD